MPAATKATCHLEQTIRRLTESASKDLLVLRTNLKSAFNGSFLSPGDVSVRSRFSLSSPWGRRHDRERLIKRRGAQFHNVEPGAWSRRVELSPAMRRRTECCRAGMLIRRLVQPPSPVNSSKRAERSHRAHLFPMKRSGMKSHCSWN